MKAILEVLFTSIHTLPCRLTGQFFLHSNLHFLGLHLFSDTTAIRTCTSLFCFR